MAAVQSLPVITDNVPPVETTSNPTTSTQEELKEDKLWQEEVNRVKAPGEFKHHFVLKAVMSCGGCSGAIDRRLKKFKTDSAKEDAPNPDEVYHEVSLEKQTAHIFTNNTNLDTVFEMIAKTKKVLKAEEVNAEGTTIKSIKIDQDGKRVD